MDINHKNTHTNTIQIKENKQLNIQQKQNYLIQSPLTTLSQEKRWAYSTTALSTTRAPLAKHRVPEAVLN